jgi:drug/metabolite transporter (DMT)-like permease
LAIFLGVCVAAFFGSGDFFGGLASKRAATLVVLLLAQTAALALALVVAPAFGGDPTARDLSFGGIAGGLNVIGLGVLFHGLATGHMGVVAPITAVISSIIPVAYGIANGEDPSTVAIIGVACAIVAGGLIAAERGAAIGTDIKRQIALSLFAGACFGVSLVLYSETSDGSNLWPVLTARGVAVPLVLIAVFATRTARHAEARELRLGIAAGFLDVSATALLLVAVREELMSLVAPLAALGPAFTVALAWIVLKEPIARIQSVGLVLAFTGFVLIASG